MEIAQFLVSCAILGMLIVIHEELRKASKEPRKAVIVPNHNQAARPWTAEELDSVTKTIQWGSAEHQPPGVRLTASEFSEAARAENLRLAREEAKRASQK